MRRSPGRRTPRSISIDQRTTQRVDSRHESLQHEGEHEYSEKSAQYASHPLPILSEMRPVRWQPVLSAYFTHALRPPPRFNANGSILDRIAMTRFPPCRTYRAQHLDRPIRLSHSAAEAYDIPPSLVVLLICLQGTNTSLRYLVQWNRIIWLVTTVIELVSVRPRG